MLQESRRASLSASVYTLDALKKAISAYSGICEVVIESSGADPMILTIRPLADAPASAIDEFLNFALDAALEERLGDVA